MVRASIRSTKRTQSVRLAGVFNDMLGSLLRGIGVSPYPLTYGYSGSAASATSGGSSARSQN
eukprot:scaffold182385_cov35-Tisochrysis_lutea.AAC.2